MTEVEYYEYQLCIGLAIQPYTSKINPGLLKGSA